MNISKDFYPLIAAALAAAFFIFVAGYFAGKHAGMRWINEHFEQETFADKIYTSLCVEDADSEDSTEGEDTDKNVEGADEKGTPELFVAQLVGFGTRSAADAYADRLRERGVLVSVKERSSVTARGKERHWYQVVTEPMEEDALDALLEQLAHRDRLKNCTKIRVVTS